MASDVLAVRKSKLSERALRFVDGCESNSKGMIEAVEFYSQYLEIGSQIVVPVKEESNTTNVDLSGVMNRLDVIRNLIQENKPVDNNDNGGNQEIRNMLIDIGEMVSTMVQVIRESAKTKMEFAEEDVYKIVQAVKKELEPSFKDVLGAVKNVSKSNGSAVISNENDEDDVDPMAEQFKGLTGSFIKKYTMN